MVVIGDSLSDNGNLSLALGATTPSRFTTNPGRSPWRISRPLRVTR